MAEDEEVEGDHGEDGGQYEEAGVLHPLAEQGQDDKVGEDGPDGQEDGHVGVVVGGQVEVKLVVEVPEEVWPSRGELVKTEN